MVRWQYIWGCLLTYSPIHATQSPEVYSHRAFCCYFQWCFWFLLLFLAHGLNTLSTTVLNSQLSWVLGLKPAQSALLTSTLLFLTLTELNFCCGPPPLQLILVTVVFSLMAHSTADLNSERSSMAECYVLSTVLHLQHNTAGIGHTLLLFLIP